MPATRKIALERLPESTKKQKFSQKGRWDLKCRTRAEKNQHIGSALKSYSSNWETGFSLQCGLVEVGEEPLEL